MRHRFSLLFILLLTTSASGTENEETCLHEISQRALYIGAGVALGSAAQLAQFGWGACLMSPWATTVGNECLLLSHLCSSAAQHAFANAFKPPKIPSSQTSWYLNQALLSQIPALSNEAKQLLVFLERRWLAKANGFFSSEVDWVCPCFGFSVQVHPESTNCYARDPASQASQTYINRVEDWKQSLPHPHYFPLILTRPFDVHEYLPQCLEVPLHENIETTIERLSSMLETANSKVVVDLTSIFPDQSWASYRDSFSQSCEEHELNRDQIICIQRIQEGEIGGIRILPLSSTEEIDLHYRYLLDWVSCFGLSANPVELARWPFPSNIPKHSAPSIEIESQSKEEFISYLNSFDQNLESGHPEKTLLVNGTLQTLKGLFANLRDDKWIETMNCPTRSSVVQLSFLKIKEHLKLLSQEEALFFNTASYVEQIHANLSSLLEIFTPFTSGDFPTIYRNLLTSIPSNLKPLTTCDVHSSGMTSITGIFKAVERSLGASPRVLYGENIYFECIKAAQQVSNSSPIEEATEEDWKEVDLILAQFNPVWKREHSQANAYRVEKIAQTLHKSLNVRQGKPLTLALDCTLDYINSPRVASLLNEFQEEIEMGTLNIICYRSGLKFDLFGMDNFAGAPFYMIHNRDAKWASFDSLSTDPVLKTDRLSLNWFCLAYKCAAPQLEQYRKQIFENTRALLNKIPPSFYNENARYRMIPFEEDADPAFVDIRVSGLFHQMKASALVGGCLYLKSMEGGHPVFYRRSLGFFHPNFGILFGEENSTIRLTLGLDPDQIDLFVQCFEMIDALNGQKDP